MNVKQLLAMVALGLLLGIPFASLGQGMVRITAPLDGAAIDAMDETGWSMTSIRVRTAITSMFISTTAKPESCASSRAAIC